MIEDFAGVVVFQMHQNGRDDLGVFVLDQVGDGRCVHPLQALDTRGFTCLQDARNQVGSLVVAQRLGQHGADVVVGVDMDGRVLFGYLEELVQDAFDLGAGNRFERRHGVADLLDLAWPQVLEHFRRTIFTERNEQRGALLESFLGASCH